MSKERPRASYKLEAHDITVTKAQRENMLTTDSIGNFHRTEIIEEGGLEWVLIYIAWQPHRPEIKLWAGDCDMELLSKLSPGESLTTVRGFVTRPDISFGRDELVTALVWNSKMEVLYKSPSFNLNLYLEQIASHQYPQYHKR